MSGLMVYAIVWPEHDVLKVGKTFTMARIRALTSTGGQVLLLMRDSQAWEEKAALRELADEFPRAFDTEWSSVHVVPRGRGFTECFTVRASEIVRAVSVIFRGIARYEHEQVAAVAAGYLQGRGPDSTGSVGEADGDRSAATRGRPGPRVDDVVDAAGGDLAGPSGVHGRRTDGSSAVARSGRIRRDLQRRGADVLPGEGVAVAVASGTVEVPEAASRTVPELLQSPSRNILGWGERRGRERAGERAGASFWSPSIAVLQTAPARDDGQLPSLRDCPSGSPAVHRVAAGGGGRMTGTSMARDLGRTRRILRQQQEWWDVVGLASQAHAFASFHEQWSWLQAVPKYLPPVDHAEWLEAERRKAGCYFGPPIISEDRQFEIASAALAAIESRLPETAEQVILLHAGGFDDQQISDRIGVSVRQVLRWRRRLNLPARSHGGAVMADQHVRLGQTA